MGDNCDDCMCRHWRGSLVLGTLVHAHLSSNVLSVQAIIGITLAITGAQVWAAWFVLAIMCIYISAYAWSWGPLGWLYSSEVQPLETRSAGQSITTLVNLMFSFVIGQVGIFSPDLSIWSGGDSVETQAPCRGRYIVCSQMTSPFLLCTAAQDPQKTPAPCYSYCMNVHLSRALGIYCS